MEGIEETQIQIAPMGPEHIGAVAALERECFSNPWSIESLAGELENPLAVYCVAGEVGGTELAGYAGMHHIIDEGHITNIAVGAPWRRRGVASRLLRALLDYAEQRGLRLLTLEVRPSNLPAITLYEAFGFRHAGTRRNYYRSPLEDALILTKML